MVHDIESKVEAGINLAGKWLEEADDTVIVKAIKEEMDNREPDERIKAMKELFGIADD